MSEEAGRNGSAGKGRRRGLVAGTTTALVAAAAIAAAGIVPGGSATATVTPTPVVLPVGATIGNCAGPTRLLSGTAGTDPQFSAASSNTVSRVDAMVLSTASGILPGTTLRALGAAGGAPEATIAKPPAGIASPKPTAGVAQTKAAVLLAHGVGGPTVLQADPVGNDRAAAHGAVTVSSADGDLRGLAASNCAAPSNDIWLAGATTTVGRTAVLDVVNSSQTPATVNLELFGAAGQIQAPGAKGLLVPAGKARSVVLAGLAPDQERLSVHLQSTGGPVSASIQQSVLRGLVPGGIDFLSPVRAPAASQVLAGIRVQAPAEADKIAAQPGYGDSTTAVQVTVPGATDAVVQVKVLGANGPQALPNGGVFTAPAGSVSQLPLKGLAAGTYAILLSADAPITATARSVNSTKAGQPVDFAHVPAAARVGDGSVVMLPRDMSDSLVFAVESGRATVSLVPVTADGKLQATRKLDVGEGRTVSVDPAQFLGSSTVGFVVAAAGDAVYASQVLTRKDKADIAVLPFPEAAASDRSLDVVLGY